MRTGEETPGTIGVLVVHGIGAQEPGETLEKLLNGLHRIAPHSISGKSADGALGQLCGQPLCFYEVYWADLHKGDITRGSFIGHELQSLSWFPWLNFCRGIYSKGSYSFFTILWWLPTLPLIGSLMWLAYQGVQFIVKMCMGFRGTVPGYTAVDRLLDEYGGDVFTYVNSARKAFYREKGEPLVSESDKRFYTSSVRRFYEQLIHAHLDGCQTIHVVAHSLGTVIMYHAMRGLRFDEIGYPDAKAVREASTKVQHLYTIGSPLEKIRFFWPRLMPSEDLADERPIAWDNFVSWFDPVAGVLRRYDEWGGVQNHRLLGGGFIRGHVVYEHRRVFLNALTHGLCGKALPLRRSWPEKLQDFVVLLLETLLAPAVFVLVLTIGLSVFVLVAVAIPFLVSIPFRLRYSPETWAPIYDWGTAIWVFIVVCMLLLGTLTRARKVHKRFWTIE